MTTPAPDLHAINDQYRDNAARHVIAVARHTQGQIMRQLEVEHGHTRLRLQFEPYIALLSQKSWRLTDIAQAIGISRQGANQVVDQIEVAGYLQRETSKMDGRVKTLSLTAAGHQLVQDAIEVIATISADYEQHINDPGLNQSGKDASAVARGLGLLPTIDRGAPRLAFYGALPRLADSVTAQLMHRTMALGHPDLKLSFGQVLTQIGPEGGRIHQMARTHQVSRQAMSAIAAELVALGYLESSPDPRDKRQRVLMFTTRGHQLISDSVASLEQLDSDIRQRVGDEVWRRFARSLAALYQRLGLEEETFGSSWRSDLRGLAEQLRRQLGPQQANDLGQLLLSRST